MPIYTRLNDRPLPSYLSVEVVEREASDGSHKFVIFHSTIHKRKQVELTFCFSTQFTDAEILRDRDVITKAIDMYGL